MRVSGKRKVKHSGKEKMLDYFDMPDFKTRMSGGLRDEIISKGIISETSKERAIEILDELLKQKRDKVCELLRKRGATEEEHKERGRVAQDLEILKRFRKELQKSGGPSQ
jgi:hypothetical protein